MMLRKPILLVREFSVFLFVGMVLCMMAHVPALAAELPPGTIINKANLDKIWNDTFQGKTIGSMLTIGQEYQIRNWALQIKIRHTEYPKIPKGFIAATKRYSKDVKFDPKTREVTGYKAGTPFPDISIDDPYAGDKMIWNYYYATMQGRSQYLPHSIFYISADTGLERREGGLWHRIFMKGRLENGGDNPVWDEKILSKTLLYITAPYDMRGIGVFSIRYDSPKFEDNWVYVKSVRRTRRLGGGAWADPWDGTDMLNDDIWVINARPSWYKSFKVLSKRTILAVANAKVNYVKGAPTLEQEFPLLDLKNWPHWNPTLLIEWEPREVWEIEGIPPSYHPYSKRIVYLDTHYPVAYISEGYDKNGKLWKYIQNFTGPLNRANAHLHRIAIPPPNDDEAMTMNVYCSGVHIDFKRRHNTTFYTHLLDVSGKLGPNDVTLGVLEAAGK